MNRCEWAIKELDIEYHDNEWCIETHDDSKIFEMLVLEGLQAGLTWSLILERRPYIKELLDNFDYYKIALYDEDKLNSLLTEPKMIRNKLKVYGIRSNAISFIKVIEEFGSFNNYIWKYVDYKPIVHHYKSWKEVPAYDELSDIISKDLKKRGFKFVGKTIIYSFMQSIGMYNDHTTTCFKHPDYNG